MSTLMLQNNIKHFKSKMNSIASLFGAYMLHYISISESLKIYVR